jgi:hypothetical protein
MGDDLAKLAPRNKSEDDGERLGAGPIHLPLRLSVRPYPLTSPSPSDLFRGPTVTAMNSNYFVERHKQGQKKPGCSMGDDLAKVDPRNKSEDDGCVGACLVSVRLKCVPKSDYAHLSSPSFSDLFRESIDTTHNRKETP